MNATPPTQGPRPAEHANTTKRGKKKKGRKTSKINPGSICDSNNGGEKRVVGTMDDGGSALESRAGTKMKSRQKGFGERASERARDSR